MTETTQDRRSLAGHDMAGEPDITSQPRRSRQRAAGRDRRHVRPGRPRQVKIRYTDDEYAALADAARLAGLTPIGYAGEAALAAARDTAPPSTAPWRVALAELMVARGQVRRFGSNVNQAARALNALGETPEWLAAAVAITERAVTRLDEAAAAVATAARADTRKASRRHVIVTDTDHSRRSDTREADPKLGQPAKGDGQPTADRDRRMPERGRVRSANVPAGEGAA